MKSFLHFILVLLAFEGLAFGAPYIVAPRQHGHIRCLQTLTLKDIFDVGFRPYRLAESICRVGKADLILALPASREAVPMDVEFISFTISRTDIVEAIVFQTKATSVKQTVEVLRRVAQSIDLGLVGLDEAMARATLDHPKRLKPWTQDWSNEWLSVRFGFQPQESFSNDASTGYLKMTAYALIDIEWKPTQIGPTYRTVPLMPPKGYEHISMEVPNSDLVAKAQASDSPALAHLRYPDEKERQEILAIAAEAAAKLKPRVSGWVSPRSWLLTSLMLAVVSGLMWWRIKRRK